jgi:hypothetical protein
MPHGQWGSRLGQWGSCSAGVYPRGYTPAAQEPHWPSREPLPTADLQDGMKVLALFGNKLSHWADPPSSHSSYQAYAASNKLMMAMPGEDPFGRVAFER